MGLVWKDAEFVTDRCPCGQIFKGPEGRTGFQMHMVTCPVQRAIRGEKITRREVEELQTKNEEEQSEK